MQVVDSYGTIKASCVGLFAESDDPDLLPPIMPNPFTSLSPTQFAQPHEGDPVWVFIFSDNPQELFYSFRNEVKYQNEKILNNDYKDIEILLKRSDDDGETLVEYNDSDGFSIKNHDSGFNIDNENQDLHLSHKNGTTVSIGDKKISLGKDGESQYKAVCGDDLVRVLNDIKSTFEVVKTAAAGSPYTAHLATALTPAIGKLTNFERILSEVVTLQKN